MFGRKINDSCQNMNPNTLIPCNWIWLEANGCTKTENKKKQNERTGEKKTIQLKIAFLFIIWNI